jgi:hypothetical protein
MDFYGETLTLLEKTAVNQLVIDLKNYNLWDYFYDVAGAYVGALYPFVGGTSGSTKVNLASPGNRIINWSSTMSFTSLGILGNGVDTWGETNVPSRDLYSNMKIIGVYINDGLVNIPTNEVDLGAFNSSLTPDGIHTISLGKNDKNTREINFDSAGDEITTTGGTYTNSMLLGQNNDGTSELWQNNNLLVSSPQFVSDLNQDFYIGARTSAAVFDRASSARGYGFAFIGRTNLTNVMNGTEIQNLYTSIYNFCNTLGRA